MYNHAPPDYACPFCRIVAGEGDTLTRPQDVVYRDALVTAFVASHWWPNNPAHVLIVPNAHYEHIYDLPDNVGAAVFAAARKIALAFKAVYGCDGTSTRQHNEPAGYQEVFHYHFHVFPRYANDYLYDLSHQRRVSTPEERQPYAARLRAYLGMDQ